MRSIAMKQKLYYEDFPEPFRSIHAFWDTAWANVVTFYAEAGIRAQFAPHQLMAKQEKISTFGEVGDA